MKKHFNNTARHVHTHRADLEIYGMSQGFDSSPDYSSYYAYPLVAICVQKFPAVHIQKDMPLIWTPRLLQDKYSQLMPPTVLKIAADYACS